LSSAKDLDFLSKIKKFNKNLTKRINMSQNQTKTITRFAPSPTGYLHIGGLRTALYNYLWAKKNDGEFKLRIEDTDLSRNKDDALKAIIKAFDWVGMQSNGEVVYQSQRFDMYKEYVQKLLDEDKAYYCYMTKDELEALRSEQEANKQTPMYDNRYRDFKGDIPKDIEPVVRIKSPLSGTIDFVDGVKGDMSFKAEVIDDFIIARSDGTPTYNFVVAIDDALMGMSEVIRGDDHLNNTPKQIVVYEALGFDVPMFYHIPMILNPQGKKLSKRDGATDVMEYKTMGYLPEALLNFLVRLGWSNGDQEIFSLEQMIELFDPKNINSSASAYNSEKLLWLNSEHIKSSSNERLINLLQEFDCDLSDNDKKDEIIELYKGRGQTLVDIAIDINRLLDMPSEYNKKGVKKFIKEATPEVMTSYFDMLKAQEDLNSADDFERVTVPFIEENGLRMPQLFQPIRLALTGGTNAPSVYDLIAIMGIETIEERFNSMIEQLETQE
jgi:glutamyl-tRNA synthetase